MYIIIKLITFTLNCMHRSALEKKKADENKIYQAIDYDAPVESEQSTIGFGTKVSDFC